jgi:hypothetical protein
MNMLIETHQHLKECIATKLAQVANESVSQFFDKGGAFGPAELPLFVFLKAVRGKQQGPLQKVLQKKFPWLSDVDIALAKFRLERDAKAAKVDCKVFIPEVVEDFGFIQSNMESILHIPIDHHPHEEEAVFVRILKKLDPFSLNQLEKFLVWSGTEKAEEQLVSVREVWRDLCVKHEINVLRNQDPGNGKLFSWKLYFIARYFKRCLKEKKGQKDTLQTLLSLSLLFDNHEELKESRLIHLADLETDTR